MTRHTTITLFDDKGRKWNIRLVRDDELVFADSRLPHTAKDEGGDLLQFYDGDQDPTKFGPLGQYVSQYLVKTLQERWPRGGLNLHGGEPIWQVDDVVMVQVERWLGWVARQAKE